MYRFSPKRLALLPYWERTLYIMVLTQLLSAMAFSNIFPFLPLYVRELGSSSGLSMELLAGLDSPVEEIVRRHLSTLKG